MEILPVVFFAQAPSSLLDALEQHFAALEGKKGSAANTPTQSTTYVFDINCVNFLRNNVISFNFR